MKNKNCITFKLGFFIFNASFDVELGGQYNQAMDAIDFPSGQSYRQEKFAQMQRDPVRWMANLGNQYLTPLEKWLDENVSDDKMEWASKDVKDHKVRDAMLERATQELEEALRSVK